MHEGAVVSAFFKLDGPVRQSKEGEVLANADLVARVETGAPLTNNDVARLHHLSAEPFYP